MVRAQGYAFRKPDPGWGMLIGALGVLAMRRFWIVVTDRRLLIFRILAVGEPKIDVDVPLSRVRAYGPGRTGLSPREIRLDVDGRSRRFSVPAYSNDARAIEGAIGRS